MRLALCLAALCVICVTLAYAGHREEMRDLNVQYRELNSRYFEGKLPPARVSYRDELPDELAETTRQGDGTFIIYVRPDANLSEILPHEACHTLSFDEPEDHGSQWPSCMERFEKR
jgi:hypothetical protein